MAMKKSEKPVSRLAIRAARKTLNQHSRNAERIQLSINSLQKDIEKLKASKDPMVSFALNRKIKELKVLQNNFERAMFKHNSANNLFEEYLSRDANSRNNG